MKKIIILIFLILGLNLIWEFSHYTLYLDLTGIPSTFHLVLAAAVDLLLVLLIILINSSIHNNHVWISKPNWKDYMVIIVLGGIIAVGIEYFSLSRGRWRYTELMPTIFGIGVSPLIQLFTTAIFSLLMLRLIKCKDKK